MEIRKAQNEELEKILSLYDSSRRFMRRNGNFEQWQNGYPGKEMILKDIASSCLYLCCEGEELLAVFYYHFGRNAEPHYAAIREGEWQGGEEYGVLHRIATSSQGRGVASFCFDWCFSRFPDLRVDTHESNLPMQRALKKNGFLFRGKVDMPDGGERLAFQLLPPKTEKDSETLI